MEVPNVSPAYQADGKKTNQERSSAAEAVDQKSEKRNRRARSPKRLATIQIFKQETDAFLEALIVIETQMPSNDIVSLEQMNQLVDVFY